MEKNQLREQILAKRLSLENDFILETSKAIEQKVLKSPYWPKTGRVGLYFPIKNEVRTQTLFQKALEAGLRVYFPRVEQGIQFYEVNGPEDLHKGSWSIMEPNLDCAELPDDENLDLIVVPGIVFSLTRHRVGYGRGFYDQLFAKLQPKTLTVGLAYDFQVIELLAVDTWDKSLTAVVTEKNFYTHDP